MRVIKAVLFDLDNTLWPIEPVIERAEIMLRDWLLVHAPAVLANATMESMRARRQALMDSDPLYQLDLRALRHAVLTEAFIDAGEGVALVDSAMEVFSRARNEVTPFADVMPALHRLRRRIPLGSVSNGVADLHSIGIAHLFDASLAAHQFGVAKPSVAIFHAACDALGVAPEEAVYVGDDLVLDVQGAQNAGMHGVWMNRPELHTNGITPGLPDHIRPDAVCGSLYDLEQWLGLA